MKYLVALGILSFGGLATIITIFSLAGMDGGWVFVAIFAPFVGSLGLFLLAREGLEARAGYRRWRNAVWMVQLAVNEDLSSVRVGDLVSALADPFLMESYDELAERRAVRLREQQDGGDHSGR